MIVPLTVSDFLDRAVTVYGDRTGVVDEPEQPAPSWGELTYREVGDRARRIAARLDELGIGFGERVAMVSHNSARLLTAFWGVSGHGRVLVPVNFRLSRDEVAYIVEHSGARVLFIDPELADSLKGIEADNGNGHTFVIGSDDDLMVAGDADPQAVGARRERHGHHQLHERYDGPAEGRAAHPSQHLGRRDDVRRAHRCHRPRRVPAHAADVPRQRLGDAVRDGRDGRAPGGAAQGRRARDPASRRAARRHRSCAPRPAVVAAVLDAAQSWDGEIPGRGRTRIVVAGAPPPTRTIQRVEQELGWEFIQIYGLTETSPLLTVNRSRQEWDDLPAEERAAKLSRAGTPAIGVRLTIDDEGEVLARSNVVLEGYWENPDETERVLEGGWFHTGDGGVVGDDGYLTIQDRKKDVIITGGENVSSIEVEDAIFSHPDVAEVAVIGVPDEKWGETIKALVVKAEGLAHRAGADRLREGQGGALTRRRRRSSSARSWTARPPASCRSSSCGRRTGKAAIGRSTSPHTPIRLCPAR